MYRGGAGNDEAKWWARFWGRVHAWGVMPRRWVTLEVPGLSGDLHQDLGRGALVIEIEGSLSRLFNKIFMFWIALTKPSKRIEKFFLP